MTKNSALSQETLTKTLFTFYSAQLFGGIGTGKWVGLILGLGCLVAIAALAYSVDLVPAGQLVAVLASAVVATLGLWVFFRKANREKKVNIEKRFR